jgi:hypothetical protein
MLIAKCFDRETSGTILTMVGTARCMALALAVAHMQSQEAARIVREPRRQQEGRKPLGYILFGPEPFMPEMFCSGSHARELVLEKALLYTLTSDQRTEP